MQIRDHRLVDHWHGPSEDVGGALTDLRFVVLHYTAGGSASGSRDYMMKSPVEKQRINAAPKKVYGSAHVVVGRRGEIWQIVPFDVRARHAGTSEWKGLKSLNQYSVGIEIANYGWLDRQGDGTYRRSDTKRFQAADVVVGEMPGSGGGRGPIKGWEPYATAQLAAVEQVVRALLSHYGAIGEVLGHQEIAPGRKFDPGPAFPMQRFRNLTDDRGFGALSNEPGAKDAPDRERLATTAVLNIRGGPGTNFEKLDDGPLAKDTVVEVHRRQARWCQVNPVDRPDVIGWVYAAYLKLV